MKNEDIEFLEGKFVKLVKKDTHFVLRGYIQKINIDSLVFKTKQAISLISLDSIEEITELKEGF